MLLQYVSLMVMAYRNATGKSEEEALRDLAIDGFVRIQDLEQITRKELLSAISRDAKGIMAWTEAANNHGATMSPKCKIANLVMNCAHCRPLSGCILSDLKGKKKQEIMTHLNVLTEDGLNRIISFHESCPYRDKVMI